MVAQAMFIPELVCTNLLFGPGRLEPMDLQFLTFLFVRTNGLP